MRSSVTNLSGFIAVRLAVSRDVEVKPSWKLEIRMIILRFTIKDQRIKQNFLVHTSGRRVSDLLKIGAMGFQNWLV